MGGWNRPNAAQKPMVKKGGAKPTLTHGIIAGAAVVVLGLAALWIFSGGDAAPEKRVGKKPAKIKTVAPVVSPDADATRGAAFAGPRKKVRVEDRAKVLSPVPTPPKEETAPAAPEPMMKAVYDNYADQVIAMVALQPEGAPMPPLVGLGPLFDKSFRENMDRPIVINEDDSDYIKMAKEQVLEARQQIKEMMAEGKTPSQILEEHQDLFNYNQKIHQECAIELQKILDEGDIEGAKKYQFKINLALQQMGVPGLEMPKTRDERRAEQMERALERRARKQQMENPQ